MMIDDHQNHRNSLNSNIDNNIYSQNDDGEDSLLEEENSLLSQEDNQLRKQQQQKQQQERERNSRSKMMFPPLYITHSLYSIISYLLWYGGENCLSDEELIYLHKFLDAPVASQILLMKFFNKKIYAH